MLSYALLLTRHFPSLSLIPTKCTSKPLLWIRGRGFRNYYNNNNYYTGNYYNRRYYKTNNANRYNENSVGVFSPNDSTDMVGPPATNNLGNKRQPVPPKKYSIHDDDYIPTNPSPQYKVGSLGPTYRTIIFKIPSRPSTSSNKVQKQKRARSRSSGSAKNAKDRKDAGRTTKKVKRKRPR